MQERLGAAEAESRRLDQLVTELFSELKRLGHEITTEYLARAYDEEHITAASYGPVVDRPLNPSEIPIHYVETPRT